MMMRGLTTRGTQAFWLTTVIAGASVLGLVGTTSAGATTPGQLVKAPPAAPSATVSVRAAHFSPQTPGVDIYLSTYSGTITKLWQSDVTYGGVTPYVAVPAGLYLVAMRPVGAAASTQAMLSWTLDARAGSAYTAAAVATKNDGAANDVKGIVLQDDLTPPPAGQARVRLIQAASNAPVADVVAVNGPTLATNAAFGTSTGYAQVPAGTWPLQARSAGPNGQTANGSVSVAPGSVSSVVLLNGPGNTLKIQGVLDAASSTNVPKGPIDAGGGAMAAELSGQSVSLLMQPTKWQRMTAVALLGLVAGFLVVARNRKRVTVRA